jgi:hypothetical protein
VAGGPRPLPEASASRLADAYPGLGALCRDVVLGRGGQAAFERLEDVLGAADARWVVEFFEVEEEVD